MVLGPSESVSPGNVDKRDAWAAPHTYKMGRLRDETLCVISQTLWEFLVRIKVGGLLASGNLLLTGEEASFEGEYIFTAIRAV